MKAAKNTEPKLPRVLTFETVKAYKANLRRYDAQRLADGVDALTITGEFNIPSRGNQF